MRSWSFSARVALPAVLVAVEAAWLSVWLAATTATGPGGRAHVPAVALALVAAIAAALSGASARRRWRHSTRLLVVLVIAGGGAALSGLALASLLDGSLLDWFAHPWSVAGQPVRGAERLAVVVAVLAWIRGTWAGWEEPSSRAVSTAAVLDAAAFTLFFVVAALGRHDHHLVALAPQAAVLALVGVPAVIAALALANERELERWRLREAPARPSAGWLVAVMAPLLAVALVALVAGLAGGPLAPAVADAARALGALLAAALEGLARLLGFLLRVHPVAHPGRAAGQPVGPARIRVAKGTTPAWLLALAVAVGAVLALGLLAVLVRLAARLLALLRRRPDGDNAAADEDEESIFSWSHLRDQLLAALARLAARLLRRRPRLDAVPGLAAGASGIGEGGGGAREAGVRAAYRDMLRAARAGGHGRTVGETPRELAARLRPVAAQAGAGAPSEAPVALAQLTGLYHRARYGAPGDTEATITAAEGALARRCADTLEQLLAAPPTAPTPDAPAGAERRLPVEPP